MPRNETWIVRLLDEEAGVPAQDIRPEQILDGIEDFRVPDHLVDPGEQHMAAVPHLALDRTAGGSLVVFQPLAKGGHLAFAQEIHRKVIAALAIARDLTLAQQFCHNLPPGILLYLTVAG